MHVVSPKRLREAALAHPDLTEPLKGWLKLAKRERWTSLEHIRQTCPTADLVGKYTVFNIKGNSYRIISEVNYQTCRIYIRNVLTHGEYDRQRWKK